MDRRSIQGLFPTLAQYSWDRVQIQQDPDPGLDKSYPFISLTFLAWECNLLSKAYISKAVINKLVAKKKKNPQSSRLKFILQLFGLTNPQRLPPEQEYSTWAIC